MLLAPEDYGFKGGVIVNEHKGKVMGSLALVIENKKERV